MNRTLAAIAAGVLTVAACTSAKSATEGQSRWVLVVYWHSHSFTELQEFSQASDNGVACVHTAETFRNIYENKGALSCQLKWKKTR